jgi:hypothetical protein
MLSFLYYASKLNQCYKTWYVSLPDSSFKFRSQVRQINSKLIWINKKNNIILINLFLKLKQYCFDFFRVELGFTWVLTGRQV